MSKRTRTSKGRKTEKQGGGPSPMTLVLGGVAVLAVVILAWNLVSTATDETVRSPVDLEVDSPNELLALAEPARRGDADAPVIMMDFSDYSCPSCQQFTSRVKPTIDREYVDRGLVRFEYYDFPLQGIFPNSFTAARAARCAGDQDAYWPYHDVLFQNQPNWSTQSDPVRTLEGYAADLGLDRDDFRACLRSDRHAEVVTANLRLGERLGVGGTPTILLNTGEGAPVRVEEWGRIDALRGLIDDALERRGYLEADDPAADPSNPDDPS